VKDGGILDTVASRTDHIEQGPYNEGTYLEYTAAKTWTYSIDVSAYINNANASSAYVRVYVAGVNIHSEHIQVYTATNFNFKVNANEWETIKITIQQGATGNSYKICIDNAYIRLYLVSYKTVWPYLYPYKLSNIGTSSQAVLYGVNPKDNVYIWGIVTDTATNVNTGEITLGNAVGFLEVNYNWQIVKVPYYS